MSENINISENFNCRICHSTSVENFRLNNLVFSSKNKNWKSFYCLACGGVSGYQIKGKEINYTDGTKDFLQSYCSESSYLVEQL